MASPRIRLAIFDLDGTAVDFGCRAPAAAMLETFSRRRIMLTMQQVRSSMGLPNYEHVRTLLEMPAVSQQFEIVHGRRWNEADVLDLEHDLAELQLEMVGRYCDLVPELLPCADEICRRGIKLGTTTGYLRATAEQIWDALAMGGFQSECNVAADDTPAGRPAPWMIFRVMQELDVFPPASVVKIGDTAADIEEGLNAGCWSLGIIHSGNEIGLSLADWRALSPAEQESRRHDFVRKLTPLCPHDMLPTLAELPATIDRLNASLALGERP
jgi:phosphonoacetaldehyde hydrolase